MEKNFLTSVKEFFGKVKREQVLSVIAVVCALICLILCISCLISVTKATKGIEAVVVEVQNLQTASAQLSERIDQLEVTVQNTQKSLNEDAAAKYINITKQPSSVSTYLGRTQAMLFSVVADGNGLNFSWQKYNESTAAWEEIVFDGTGYNTELGIRLYDDSGNGTSELWTNDLQSGAFGTYRCLLTDNAGTTLYTDTVQVIEKAAS